MNYVYHALLSVIFFGCSSETKSLRSQSDTILSTEADAETSSAVASDSANEPANNPIATTETSTKDSDVVDLDLVQVAPAGSQFRLMNSVGLDKIYARVFSRRATGFYGISCPNKVPACKDSIFNPAESTDMGSLVLAENVTNFREQKNFSLNYLRSLRVALQRECSYLVTTEWNALEKGTVIGSNKLVKKLDVPDEAALEGFMRILVGINGLSVKIDFGISDYVKGFSEVRNKAQENEATLIANIKNAYIATCISLSMDPLVIMY